MNSNTDKTSLDISHLGVLSQQRVLDLIAEEMLYCNEFIDPSNTEIEMLFNYKKDFRAAMLTTYDLNLFLQSINLNAESTVLTPLYSGNDLTQLMEPAFAGGEDDLAMFVVLFFAARWVL